MGSCPGVRALSLSGPGRRGAGALRLWVSRGPPAAARQLVPAGRPPRQTSGEGLAALEQGRRLG